MFVQEKGRRRSHIDPVRVENLLGQFRDADFFSLKDRYITPMTDMPTYTVSVRIGAESKTVEDYVGAQDGMPEVVTHLENAIDAAANTARWIGSNVRERDFSRESQTDCSTPNA